MTQGIYGCGIGQASFGSTRCVTITLVAKVKRATLCTRISLTYSQEPSPCPACQGVRWASRGGGFWLGVVMENLLRAQPAPAANCPSLLAAASPKRCPMPCRMRRKPWRQLPGATGGPKAASGKKGRQKGGANERCTCSRYHQCY